MTYTKSIIDQALEKTAIEISNATHGNRQTTLAKAAYTLGGYIPKFIDYHTAKHHLESCVNQNPSFHSQHENWLYTIEYNLNKGQDKPFDIDDHEKGKHKPKFSPYRHRKPQPIKPPSIQPEPAIYSFEKACRALDEPYKLIELASKLEFDGNIDRMTAEQLTIKSYGLDTIENRLFRICYAPSTHNKYVKPLPSLFEPIETTIDGIIDIVSRGQAITSSMFKPEGTAKAYKDKVHWQGSELIILDMDNISGNIDDLIDRAKQYDLLFAYTTPSHTETSPRMRLILYIDEFHKDLNFYNRTVKALSKIIGSDEVDNAAHAYYGNTNTTIYKDNNGY